MVKTSPTSPRASVYAAEDENQRTASASAIDSTHEIRHGDSPSTPVPTDRRTVDPIWTTVAPWKQRSSTHSSLLNTNSELQGPYSKPMPEFRGRDWESWRLKEADKLTIDIEPSYSQARSKFMNTVRPVTINVLQQQKPHFSLTFSNIQSVLVYSPSSPVQETIPFSPISVGPHGTESTRTSNLSSPQPLSPDRVDIPKYDSAFEYAMRPYLDTHIDLEHHLYLPPPAQQDTCSVSSTPLLPPLRDDEISYAGSEADESEKDVPHDGIPARMKERDVFRTCIRHVHLRTLLMRCIILQTTVREIERKPWAHYSKQPPRWYYSKMRNLAYKARRITEGLESDDLQARCEYWAGRGCGGTRDYQAAQEHFENAIKLDIENDKYPSGRLRMRGLKLAEKADIRFLLDSVSDRHEKWERETADTRAVARYLSEKFDKPVEEYIDQDRPESPLWMPDRDRIVQLASREFGIRKKLGRKAKYLGDLERLELDRDLEDRVQAQWASEGIDDAEMTRRVMDEEEWKYIWNGDAEAAERRTRRESATRDGSPCLVNSERPSNSTNISSPSSSSSSSSARDDSKKLNHLTRTLADEMEGADWDESRSPSPTASTLPGTPQISTPTALASPTSISSRRVHR